MYAHVFLDAENVNPRVFFEAYTKLKTKYLIKNVQCFCNKSHLPNVYKQWDEYHNNFNIINCTVERKVNADVIMAMYITQAIFEELLTDIFIIITDDKDFFPVIKNVIQHGKKVIYVSHKEHHSYLDSMSIEKLTISLPKKDIYKWHIPQSKQQYAKNLKLTTIYIKEKSGKLWEVSFCNGICVQNFREIIPIEYITAKDKRKLSEILYDSYLLIRGNNVYIDTERILQDEEENNLLAEI